MGRWVDHPPTAGCTESWKSKKNYVDLAENVFSTTCWGRRGYDRIIVGFTVTYAISGYHH
jgi:hypothetical protein